ncbi:C1 family peptidase [Hansschlegelia quercus]|nr:C1 family peptidase [Hansschlegelia quercus]
MLDVEILSSALASRNATWTAAPTRLTSLPADMARALAGAMDEPLAHTLSKASSATLTAPHSSTEMPAVKVDWRDNGGNYVSPVRDQDLCRSCVAFATCAVMESSLRISESAPGLALALAPRPLFFCGHPAGCSVGRYASDIMSSARNGVALEAAAPYSVADQTCKAIAPALRVTGIRQCAGDLRTRKFFVADEGPVYAEMRLFDDFLAYTGGVYRHVQGADNGLHAVVVIGYDDAEHCWICLNSWGAQVQENGFFRIGYGECEIDARPFIALDVDRVTDAVS